MRATAEDRNDRGKAPRVLLERQGGSQGWCSERSQPRGAPACAGAEEENPRWMSVPGTLFSLLNIRAKSEVSPGWDLIMFAMVRMDLFRIVINDASDQAMVVLKEAHGTRAFPIVIGAYEARAIYRYVCREKTPRPLTHDLAGGIVRGLGFRIERVNVTDLKDGIFYASMVLKKNGTEIEVDSRPSDAIAMAMQFGCPIFVEDQVIRQALADAGPNGQTEEEEPGQEGPEEEEE